MKIDILKKTNIFHYFPSKNLKYSQIFLSETIHAQENGSRGPHFAKSLNSNFLKGLTYSALLPFLPREGPFQEDLCFPSPPRANRVLQMLS